MIEQENEINAFIQLLNEQLNMPSGNKWDVVFETLNETVMYIHYCKNFQIYVCSIDEMSSFKAWILPKDYRERIERDNTTEIKKERIGYVTSKLISEVTENLSLHISMLLESELDPALMLKINNLLIE